MLTRRDFLRALGAAAGVAIVGEAVSEPVRRIWQVSRNAPVGLTFNPPTAAELDRICRLPSEDELTLAGRIWLNGEHGFTFGGDQAFTLDKPLTVPEPSLADLLRTGQLDAWFKRAQANMDRAQARRENIVFGML